jgi:hypothetical protein
VEPHKLHTVRLTLPRGNISKSAKYGSVFELTLMALK